jgi:hypothetical protein
MSLPIHPFTHLRPGGAFTLRASASFGGGYRQGSVLDVRHAFCYRLLKLAHNAQPLRILKWNSMRLENEKN